MQERECIVVKLADPTKRRADWLDDMADRFRQAVQFGLDVSGGLRALSCTESGDFALLKA